VICLRKIFLKLILNDNIFKKEYLIFKEYFLENIFIKNKLLFTLIIFLKIQIFIALF
jgi:hypothetical protein